MSRSAQRNSISDGIGTFVPVTDGPYVRCLHFDASTAIDQFQTREPTGALVSRPYFTRERGVTKWSGN
jgi:hypothetical protein